MKLDHQWPYAKTFVISTLKSKNKLKKRLTLLLCFSLSSAVPSLTHTLITNILKLCTYSFHTFIHLIRFSQFIYQLIIHSISLSFHPYNIQTTQNLKTIQQE